jgi:hypothetical protein
MNGWSRLISGVVATLAGAGVLAGSAAASTTAVIDRFVITRSAGSNPVGQLFYDDQFSNGLAPQNGVLEPAGGGAYFNGDPGTYGLTAAFPQGAEAGGKLSLDTSAGGLVSSASGLQFLRIGATLLSDTIPSNGLGLEPGFNFSVRARIDLVSPVANLDGYGLELTDSSAGNFGNDRLQFMVRRDGSGVALIQLIDQRFEPTGGVSIRADVPLAPPTDTTQLSMFLDHFAANAGAVYASFYYVNASGVVYDPVGGVWTTVLASDSLAAAQYRTYLGATGRIFDDNEGFVRAGFFAVQLVPEPGTYAMLLAGLAVLGWVGQRRIRA